MTWKFDEYRAFGDDYPGVFPHPHPDEELAEGLLAAAVRLMEQHGGWPSLDEAINEFRGEPDDSRRADA